MNSIIYDLILPKGAEFISDEAINTAEEMDSFKKIRLGFVIDRIHYHIVMYDIYKKGFWVIRLKS
jgi:hypothetical protein